MCYFSRLFVIQLKIKIPQTNNCNFDFYVTLNFTEYILWIKHKPQIKYQYILLVDSTFYHILFSDSSECRNNMFKDQFVCCLPVIICSAFLNKKAMTNFDISRSLFRKYDIVKCAINKQNILIFTLRFVFYPKNVLSKVKSHIKVKITVVCLQNSDFKLDYKKSVKITHICLQILLEPTF